jgi:hypothetical protein
VTAEQGIRPTLLPGSLPVTTGRHYPAGSTQRTPTPCSHCGRAATGAACPHPDGRPTTWPGIRPKATRYTPGSPVALALVVDIWHMSYNIGLAGIRVPPQSFRHGGARVPRYA